MKYSREELKELIEWDIINWSRALEYWEVNSSIDFSKAEVLDLGSRHGGLSLWLANKGANVLCTDLNCPSERANNMHLAHHVSHLINYSSLDATDIGYKDRFDIVIFKSMLGGIGAENITKEKVAIEQIYKSLKKGGELLFAENLLGLPIYQPLRKQYVWWYDIWRYISLDEMLDYLSIFDDLQYSTTGVLGLLGRSERQRELLGHLDQLFLSSIVPDRWRYIMFGIARK